MIVTFKSDPKMFEKEMRGIKNNTVREIDEDKRFYQLDRKIKGWDQEPTHICIENTENKQHFVREITDVTRWKDLIIITWRRE